MVRAGIVSHPREWEWGGYREIMGERKRNPVDRKPGCGEHGVCGADAAADPLAAKDRNCRGGGRSVGIAGGKSSLRRGNGPQKRAIASSLTISKSPAFSRAATCSGDTRPETKLTMPSSGRQLKTLRSAGPLWRQQLRPGVTSNHDSVRIQNTAVRRSADTPQAPGSTQIRRNAALTSGASRAAKLSGSLKRVMRLWTSAASRNRSLAER